MMQKTWLILKQIKKIILNLFHKFKIYNNRIKLEFPDLYKLFMKKYKIK